MSARYGKRLLINLLTICLLLIPAGVSGAKAPPGVAIPDTPAGTQFAGWLDAFNSGKRETLRAFIETHFDAPPNRPLPVDDITDQNFSMYATSHGFEVKKILSSAPAAISALVQAKATGFWLKLDVVISAEPPAYTVAKPPYKIAGIGNANVEAPVEFLPKEKLAEGEITKRLNDLLSKLVAADAFSGTVVVSKDGKPFYKWASGLADRAWKIPNRVNTKFNLASITKMFTAVAVAQLVEQGKLSYTDTVGKILPDYPNPDVARQVTVRQLLSHTAGMISARALVEKGSGPMNARTIAEMVKPFAGEPLSHPPGQQFDYSNAGFILLGAIVEKASGQSYYDYVREHIFIPAGMTDTDFYELDTDPVNLATGFADGPNHTRLNNIFDLGVKGSPAGGAYSNGLDMTRFHQALVHHTLLSEKSLETLWTGVTENPGRNSEYGYGAQISHYNGSRIIWHGGGWKGITNQFEMYPERGYTVVILSNYDDDPASIADKLREWLTQGMTTEKPVPQTAPKVTLSAAVSATSVTKGSPITITVTVQNEGGTAHASIVDMEVKDAQGAKADQQFTMDQKIEQGKSRTFQYTWTPVATGTYTIDIGAFGPGWATKYDFQSGVAIINVN